MRSNAMCGEEDGTIGKGETVVRSAALSSFRVPDLFSSFSLPSSSVQQRQKHLSAASSISRGARFFFY